MNVLNVLCTDVGEFPVPPEMIVAAQGVRFRPDGWPDMRTKAGKNWVKLFKEFSDCKLKEYLSNADR